MTRNTIHLVGIAACFSWVLAACPAKEPPPAAEPPDLSAGAVGEEGSAGAAPATRAAEGTGAAHTAALDAMEAELDGYEQQFQGLAAKPSPSCPDVCKLLTQVCATSGRVCAFSYEHPESTRAGEICGRSRTLCLDDRTKALSLCGPCPEGS